MDKGNPRTKDEVRVICIPGPTVSLVPGLSGPEGGQGSQEIPKFPYKESGKAAAGDNYTPPSSRNPGKMVPPAERRPHNAIRTRIRPLLIRCVPHCCSAILAPGCSTGARLGTHKQAQEKEEE